MERIDVRDGKGSTVAIGDRWVGRFEIDGARAGST